MPALCPYPRDFCTLHANLCAYQPDEGNHGGGGSCPAPHPELDALLLHPSAHCRPSSHPWESLPMARNIIHLNDWVVCTEFLSAGVEPWKCVFPLVHRDAESGGQSSEFLFAFGGVRMSQKLMTLDRNDGAANVRAFGWALEWPKLPTIDVTIAWVSPRARIENQPRQTVNESPRKYSRRTLVESTIWPQLQLQLQMPVGGWAAGRLVDWSAKDQSQAQSCAGQEITENNVARRAQ